MENHLKHLNFEEKIPTNFTDENRQAILKRINHIEKKSNKKLYLVPTFLTLAVVSLLIFLGINLISDSSYAPNEHAGSKTKESTKHVSGQEQTVHSKMIEEENKEKLKVGVNVYRIDPERNNSYSNSNYNLFVAHLRSAMITGNGIFGNDTIPMGNDVYRMYLKSILTYLDNVEPNGEKVDKLHQAIQLTTQAINNNVEIGDPILDKINTILRELDEYFNGNPFIEGKTNEHGIQLWK